MYITKSIHYKCATNAYKKTKLLNFIHIYIYKLKVSYIYEKRNYFNRALSLYNLKILIFFETFGI